jgi:hypothetical protein
MESHLNNQFIPTPAITMSTRMPKHQFDILLANMACSDQPETQPEGMSSEKYQWRLVDDFVMDFNKHQHAHFWPSEMISIDESNDSMVCNWWPMDQCWVTNPCAN